MGIRTPDDAVSQPPHDVPNFMIGSCSFCDRWSPRLLSLLRIVVGLLFLSHGSQKLFGFPAGPGGGGPGHFPLLSMMGIAGILEFFGGVLIVVGLGTRAVALILSGQMAVAYWIAHAPQGLWPVLNRGELAVLYCFVFIYFVVAGGGEWSLDRCVAGRWRGSETKTDPGMQPGQAPPVQR